MSTRIGKAMIAVGRKMGLIAGVRPDAPARSNRRQTVANPAADLPEYDFSHLRRRTGDIAGAGPFGHLSGPSLKGRDGKFRHLQS